MTTAATQLSPDLDKAGSADGKGGTPPTPYGACAMMVSDADCDLDAITWSMKLASVRRYYHQRFWEDETKEAEYASRIEPDPRLESVAEHSWHVADAVLILAPRFPLIDIGRALALSVLHDKMEIKIGDWSPVGRDGTGDKTHAFDTERRKSKEDAERKAIEQYLRMLSPAASELQQPMFHELLEGRTDEAKFVKAVDKLQALVYVVVKKSGRMNKNHLRFTMRYSEKVMIWPGLELHLTRMRERLFASIADNQKKPIEEIKAWAKTEQMTLFED
ncbi:HD domain-containing protein [Streptomyces cylindrosporus]|uniref:HD domain-containing protein n=1 Tax=Streptomyces cylindrosporus TaxID=2927583 RepID=A0ABS9XXI0_9ACTN|nr:HD domain-containing protein [Streptomyces cylindrosporus]MCI3269663.1 HD domain-containing protein [Streptomyces cylindrosporus]